MPDWTVEAVAQAIRARRLSALEVTDQCLRRIARRDGALRAFITVDAENARRAARERDEARAAGQARGPLHGVPLAFKDLCAVPGLAASCGTRTPDYFTPDGPCTAVARLTAAGAVTLGTLNMSELALGPFGDNAHHGDVDNPWRAGYCSGGSSSGSAASVAAGLALATLGTDTGGSIRVPAACCGIVGLKPTYGRVSRAGVMPLSWSNDHVGPMTAAVRDAALILGVIAGLDGADTTASRHAVPDYLDGIEDGVEGLRVGLPENYYFDGVDEAVAVAAHALARALGSEGARVVAVRVPDPRTVADVSSLAMSAESAAIHGRLLGRRPEEVQPVVRARLEVGRRVSAYDYLQATRLRARLARAFAREVFADVDVLVVPTTPEPAPLRSAATAGPVSEVVPRVGRFSRLTRPLNGLGLPVLAVPSGLSRLGLPLSAQIVGRPFDEATVLRAGRTWERLRGGFDRPPVD